MSSYEWTSSELASSLIQLEKLQLYLASLPQRDFSALTLPRLEKLVKMCIIIIRDRLGHPTGHTTDSLASLLHGALDGSGAQIFLRGNAFKDENGVALLLAPLQVSHNPMVEDMFWVPMDIVGEDMVSLQNIFTTVQRFQSTFSRVARQTSNSFPDVKAAVSSVASIFLVMQLIIGANTARKSISSREVRSYIAEKISLALGPYNIRVFD